jgi:hypothetical protein
MGTTLLLGLVLVLAVLVWHTSMRALEHANQVAAEVCQKSDLTLLDGTVSLRRLRPVRDEHGNLVLRRSYSFDYSADGFSRSVGFVVLRGRQLEAVGLAGPGPAAHPNVD